MESLNVTSGSVTGSGTNTIIAQWTNALEHSTSYCVQIDNTALQATDGTAYAGISDQTSFNFTTMGLPYLTSSSPTDNTTGMSVATQSLKLTFNEAVSSNTGNIKVIETVSGETFESFDVTGSRSGMGNKCDHPCFFKNFSVSSNYHVLIDNNAIKNSGSAFTEAFLTKRLLISQLLMRELSR